MEKETWKPVVGYEGIYEVSNWGRVRSQSRRGTKGGIMKPTPAKRGGYPQVILCKNGKREPCKVHQLVMEAFVDKCPDDCEVDHFDWNPNNNRLDNLSYQPKEVNRARHSHEWYKNTAEAAKKRAADPEWQRKNAEAVRKARSKPVDQFTLDGVFIKRWTSAADAERGLGVHHQKISACCNGKVKTASGFIWKFAEPC